MAMIAIRVPFETARLFEKISGILPGNNLTASDMHITIAYLGEDAPIDQIAKAMIACHSITSKTAPFMLTVNSVSSFDPGENGTPVILPVDSDELHELEKKLKEELDRTGVEYSKKYKEFKPHVTMSYIPQMNATGILQSPISWAASELNIYGANDGQGRVLITLPFESMSTEIKLQKIASRICARTYKTT